MYLIWHRSLTSDMAMMLVQLQEDHPLWRLINIYGVDRETHPIEGLRETLKELPELFSSDFLPLNFKWSTSPPPSCRFSHVTLY